MKCNNCILENKIFCICSNQYEYFFNKPNVVGVGLGYKIKNGYYTPEKCLNIFVSKKISNNELSEEDMIPLIYHEVKTDVIESGSFKPCSFTGRYRPVKGGCGIGPSTANVSGTVGCLVKDAHGIYILSNNHILTNENDVTIGTPELQPSILNKGVVSRDTVAYLSKYIQLKFSNRFSKPVNYVDCAMAKILSQHMVSPKIELIGNLEGVQEAKLNDHVAKVGSISELTTGIVTNIGVTVRVPFKKGDVIFKNQIFTTKMSEQGDSGSVLVNIKKYAIGLLCSQSDAYTCYNSMSNVLKDLNVSIVTK